MNPQDVLAQLRDIHEPPAPGWWPIAPGWWILAVIAVLAIAAVIYWSWQRYQANAWRRASLGYLTKINALTDVHEQSRSYGRLVKFVMSHRCRDHSLARLTGQEWADFLRTNNSGKHLTSDDLQWLATGQYQAHTARPPGLAGRLKQWIRQC